VTVPESIHYECSLYLIMNAQINAFLACGVSLFHLTADGAVDL